VAVDWISSEVFTSPSLTSSNDLPITPYATPALTADDPALDYTKTIFGSASNATLVSQPATAPDHKQSIPTSLDTGMQTPQAPSGKLPLPIMPASIKCPRCSYSSALMGLGFRRHLAKHKLVICDVEGCGKSMVDDVRTLERHKHAKHKSLFQGILERACICGYKTIRKDHFTRHARKCQSHGWESPS